MRTLSNSLILAAFALSSLGGCIVQREVVREDPQAAMPAPPPSPADDADASPAAPVATDPAPGQEVDEQVFTERLSPYGHWEWVADYGNVWVPAVAAGWQPYWYGHWVLTDWGWTFVSDEPWGWATYHYGRWGFGDSVGWFWIPGRVWGPAWVSWRYGGGYYAWAPLGPHGRVYGYNSRGWVAVRQEHFTEPIVRNGIVNVRQTAPIVQRAQALPAPRVRPAPGVHFGPSVASVSAATGRPIHAVSAAAVVPRTPVAARPAVSAGVGRSGGAVPPARPVPSASAPRGQSATPSGGPVRAQPRPGSSSGSGSGHSQPQSTPSTPSTPRAAPSHGGSGTYRMRVPAGSPQERFPTGTAAAAGGRAGAGHGGAAPSGGIRYGGGPAPRVSPGHAPAAAPRGNRRTR